MKWIRGLSSSGTENLHKLAVTPHRHRPCAVSPPATLKAYAADLANYRAWREPRTFNGARRDRTHALCLSRPRERDDLKLAVDDVRDFAVKREMVALFGPALSERLDGRARGSDHQPFR